MTDYGATRPDSWTMDQLLKVQIADSGPTLGRVAPLDFGVGTHSNKYTELTYGPTLK